jgi:hypothetical protein
MWEKGRGCLFASFLLFGGGGRDFSGFVLVSRFYGVLGVLSSFGD